MLNSRIQKSANSWKVRKYFKARLEWPVLAIFFEKILRLENDKVPEHQCQIFVCALDYGKNTQSNLQETQEHPLRDQNQLPREAPAILSKTPSSL